MSKFKPYVKNQPILFPNAIEDYVPESHLARVIENVVEKLNTTDIENKYSNLGQKSYHPKILIKLLFYGYTIGERSGRTIEKKNETDTAYMYLSQNYKPDFRTINDFRKNNLEEISKYFIDIIKYCQQLGLVEVGQINIDGTKINANASRKMTKNKEQCEKWLQKIEEKIDGILQEANERDAEEDELYGDNRGDELPEDINTPEKMKAKIEAISQEFKNKEQKDNEQAKKSTKEMSDEQIKKINAAKKLKTKVENVINQFEDDQQEVNITDNDAPKMKKGIQYNCQAAVTSNQIIVGADVITDANDKQALEPMVEQAQENLDKTINDIAADCGYSSYDNSEYLSKNNKDGYIPDQYFSRLNNGKLGKYHHENFKYDENQDIYICPEGQTLTKHRIKNDRGNHYTIYKCHDCHKCPVKKQCTKYDQRTISRERRRPLLEQMRKLLLTEKGKLKYLERMYTTEPVFGNIKHNLGYRYFLLRSLEKVKYEFKLMCIAHNIQKIFQLGAIKM